MKISCIQMDMQLGEPDRNFAHARELILKAVSEEHPDTVVLPETWNTGFFPKEDLAALSDRDGRRVTEEIGSLAASCSVNIVAGSVANVRGGKIFNTCLVFDRSGGLVASYDKTHLFTPMGEDRYFTPGDHLCRFRLDGISCGVIICYDVRFPELIRSLSVPGMDLMFMVSQWPEVRTAHLRTLTAARAIENQMFVACCNSCGTAGETRYGGNSSILDPWGVCLAEAGTREEILTAECDFSVVDGIRNSINVFADRRPDHYNCN